MHPYAYFWILKINSEMQKLKPAISHNIRKNIPDEESVWKRLSVDKSDTLCCLFAAKCKYNQNRNDEGIP